MITWLPLAGRLVEFIATKLLGNKLDATLDNKKRACRAFLELHDALFEVEQLTYVSGIARLAARCRERVQPVAAARAKLHEFVAAEFSIEDLLYVGSGTSARVTGWPPRL